jgi:hypothetical protein
MAKTDYNALHVIRILPLSMNKNQFAAGWQALGEEIQQLSETYRSKGESQGLPGHEAAASKIEGYLSGFRAMAEAWATLSAQLPPLDEDAEDSPSGTTPQRAFYRPLADALLSLGGSARTRDAIASVGKAMGSVLKPADFDPVPSGQIRWMVNVRFARQKLREHGLLAADEIGRWTLSSAGIRWAESPQADLPDPVAPENPDQTTLPF